MHKNPSGYIFNVFSTLNNKGHNSFKNGGSKTTTTTK